MIADLGAAAVTASARQAACMVPPGGSDRHRQDLEVVLATAKKVFGNARNRSAGGFQVACELETPLSPD